jgi:hypothetical protein
VAAASALRSTDQHSLFGLVMACAACFVRRATRCVAARKRERRSSEAVVGVQALTPACQLFLDVPNTTQGVWKPDGTSMRRVTADPSGAFDRLCDYHGADERVYPSDTF